MGTYPRKRKVTRKGKRFATKGRKRVAKPSKSFAKKVLKVVHEQVETKQAYHIMAPTNFNSGIDAAGDAIRILPNVAQGTAENNRIGNQLKAQNLTLQGCVSWSPSIGTFGSFANARLGVRLFVIQPRNYSEIGEVLANTSTWMPTLLQKGGVATPFTGAINDLWAPLNSDAFIKYYDRVFMLNGTYQSTAVGMTQLLGATKMFKIALKCRNKTIKYENGISSVNPMNYAPVFCIGYAHMDGSGADTVSTAITVQWDAVFNYEDA
jgi:hypothetical protein